MTQRLPYTYTWMRTHTHVQVTQALLEVASFDKAALLLCALREAHEQRRGALAGGTGYRVQGTRALAGFAFRGAARVLLEFAAFLSRLPLPALTEHYCRLASSTADSIGGAEDEPLTEAEAAQLVTQLGRLQERREEQQF